MPTCQCSYLKIEMPSLKDSSAATKAHYCNMFQVQMGGTRKGHINTVSPIAIHSRVYAISVECRLVYVRLLWAIWASNVWMTILLYTQAVEPILSPLLQSLDSSRLPCLWASNCHRNTRKVPLHKPLPLLQIIQLLVERDSVHQLEILLV